MAEPKKKSKKKKKSTKKGNQDKGNQDQENQKPFRKMVSFWIKFIVLLITLTCCIIANAKSQGDPSDEKPAKYYSGENAPLMVSAQSLFIMVCAGYCLILIVIIISYIWDSFLKVEDMLFTLAGFFLFCGAGAIGVWGGCDTAEGKSILGLAVGAMLLLCALLLLIDFILIAIGKGGCQ